jgi:acyl-homoserine-lactone acylase
MKPLRSPKLFPICLESISRLFERNAVRVLLLVLSFVLTFLFGTYSPAANPRATEILWDTVGVPHIFGKDVPSAFHAFGWAQMQSHGNLLLRLYGQARGRAAEYWGKEYLASDRWVQTMGIPDRAHKWYEAQNSTFRRALDAFAAGINAYAAEHPDLINDDVKRVLPINAVDVLAHSQRVLHFTFVVDPQMLSGLTDGDAPRGSNAWAIAPSHSESGNAMLLANPHLPWSDLFLWYEAQITAPGIDAYGATLVGIPVLSIAFNDHLGWTHTVNTHDGWDAYELSLSKGGYRFDGKVRPFEQEERTLNVKQPDGTLRKEKLIVQRSIHGPVIKEDDNKAIALRVVGLDQPGLLEQWWDMARATSLSQFQTALRRLQLPMFTVMYADRQGHIMHLFNGQVPVRNKGDFADWEGIIPGDTSKTLWTIYHRYNQLPRILDPASGWLQNANDPPWTTTFPSAINADDYPPYMAPRGPMNFRAQSSARMLAEDSQISFQEMIQYKHSTHVELADRVLDDLLFAAAKDNSEIAHRAVQVLKAWDRNTNVDSRGAVLFAAWVEGMNLSNAFATPWNENAPRTTPNGLSNPKNAVATLKTAATKVKTAYGALDIPWGDVFRLRYGSIDLPANGGPGRLGVFRVVNFVPNDKGQFESNDGDTFVAAIEFSNPVRAMVLTSYGNATQPNSPHVGDQLKQFAQKQLRPVWRSRQDILTHLVERQTF